jgi:hypothetical protein
MNSSMGELLLAPVGTNVLLFTDDVGAKVPFTDDVGVKVEFSPMVGNAVPSNVGTSVLTSVPPVVGRFVPSTVGTKVVGISVMMSLSTEGALVPLTMVGEFGDIVTDGEFVCTSSPVGCEVIPDIPSSTVGEGEELDDTSGGLVGEGGSRGDASGRMNTFNSSGSDSCLSSAPNISALVSTKFKGERSIRLFRCSPMPAPMLLGRGSVCIDLSPSIK